MLSARPQLIVFDLDGTLVDSAPDLADAIDATLQRLGLPPAGEASVRQWIGDGVSMLMQRALTGSLWPAGKPADNLEEGLKLFMDIYSANVCRRSKLYDGVLEGLQALKNYGYSLAIFTNKHSLFTHLLLQQLGIAKYLDFVGCADQFLHQKPDPEGLFHIASHFNVCPTNCLMVGDSETDTKTARAAGYGFVAVPYGYRRDLPIEALQADAVIDSLADLPALLASLP